MRSRRGAAAPRWARLAGATAAWALAVACQSDAVVSQGAACTYLQTIACTGANGCAGVRTCTPDLVGYGPCVCGDAGSTDAGADASDGRAAR